MSITKAQINEPTSTYRWHQLYWEVELSAKTPVVQIILGKGTKGQRTYLLKVAQLAPIEVQLQIPQT